jgi:hypothetical protein
MAGTVSDYMERLIRVQSQLGNEVDDIIISKEEQILNLNREDQLFNKGIDINGSLLGKYRNTLNGIGRGYPKNAGDTFNFYDTGSLFGNFSLLSEGNANKVVINNSDSKVNLLTTKYGDFIGLTEENKHRLNYEIIYPELMEFIKQYL